MPSRFLFLNKVGFRYPAMSAPLIDGISTSFPAGWTGIVGPNGAGKTTVLKLCTGLLEPTEGRVRLPEEAAYCAQRTDDVPLQFDLLAGSADSTAVQIRARLRIQSDWAHRWDSLSHGERKRAQIAAALWRQPGVLALDEPTNHIDADARALLVSALADYRGIGLLVSHDRELLDLLCRNCLFLDPPDAVLRPGGYSAGRRQGILEEDSARRRREVADRKVARLKKESQRRVSRARAAARNNSKRNLAPKDHDGRARIDLARLTGADGHAAKLAGRMQSRLGEARKAAREIRVQKKYSLGIWIEGERCRSDTLFRATGGTLSLGTERTLEYPDLVLLPGDRVAVTGANGTGKSTFVRFLVNTIRLPPERLTYLPQEIDLRASAEILASARCLPSENLGRVMTAVSRLGSRPDRLLATEEPSPGELRKLLLAIGIASRPHLIVMDEPTNHLDLPSIECLEDALSDCPCGLLLVSHDESFLRRLTRKRWHITADTSGRTALQML